MASESNDSHKSIKVEDLLRLKRSERPTDTFWNEFDRELHQRMLQTLVKKDPWYRQLMRAFSGPRVQTLGVSCAALFVAMLLMRPATFERTSSQAEVAAVSASIASASAVVVNQLALSDLSASSRSDYQIEMISSEVASVELGFTRDFSLEGIQVASEDSDYSMNFGLNGATFGSTGVVSLAF